jgi:phenylalanyl-tRNA synthetase beta subunit
MSIPVTLFSKTCQGDMSKMDVVMEAVSHENGKKVVKVTLRQVAQLAGVSLTTASRVLNGHANVSPQVRERVWEVINENGYQPDQVARSLAARRAPKKH